MDMTHEDWVEVHRPKAGGAWNLHEALRDYDLDFFVLASSLNTADPIPGQSNYCAANTWLEGLCHYRRSCNLPASVLSIGAIEGAGFISENAYAEKSVRKRGHLFLPPEKLMDYLELAILCSRPEEVIDESRPWAATGHLLMGMVADSVRHMNDGRWGYYLDRYATHEQVLPASGKRLKHFLDRVRRDPTLLVEETSIELLAEEIGKRVFSFLLKAEEDVSPSLSMTDIGLDSLVSIELRRWWKRTFNQETSTLEIMGAGTLLGLGQLAADCLSKQL